MGTSRSRPRSHEDVLARRFGEVARATQERATGERKWVDGLSLETRLNARRARRRMRQDTPGWLPWSSRPPGCFSYSVQSSAGTHDELRDARRQCERPPFAKRHGDQDRIRALLAGTRSLRGVIDPKPRWSHTSRIELCLRNSGTETSFRTPSGPIPRVFKKQPESNFLGFAALNFTRSGPGKSIWGIFAAVLLMTRAPSVGHPVHRDHAPAAS